MPNVKITDMTPGAALSGPELFEMSQGGQTFSTTADDIKTFVGLGDFTITGGTVTDPAAALSITQTWNDGADTFTLISANVTNTASAAASKLIDLQVGGVSQFNVTRGGALTATGPIKAAGYAVGSLPAGVVGQRAYVTDSNAALTAGIGAVVAGGGANVVPVFYDGANWRIG